MRSLSTLLAIVALAFYCTAALAAAASPFSLFSTGQKPLQAIHADNDEGRPIPGDNPLHTCPGPESEKYIVIEHVNLKPNPPQAGRNLTIEAAGVVKKKIEQGAYVVLSVSLQLRYGPIKLLDTQADLCDEVKNVDLKCPLEPGHTVVTKDVALPNHIPKGTYNVKADVYTKDRDPISCLMASVHFGG